jgi:hypothetical protein
MSTVQEIETVVARLPLEDKRALRDWLDGEMEEELERSAEFKAKVERAKQELAAGIHSRVRQPKPME